MPKKYKDRKSAMAAADRWFSRYIRLRDATESGYVRCCTSGKLMHWKNCDAGHFMSRRFQSTRYDERNCHPQSKQENRFLNGNQIDHQKYINERYGDGVADELFEKSKMMCHRKKHDFEFIAEEYKEKAKKLGYKS